MPLPHQVGTDAFPLLAAAQEILTRDRTRLPFMVEFCGLPKAGKSTLLSRTARTLNRLGLRAVVISEAATTKIDTAFREDLLGFNVLTCLENITQVVRQARQRQDVDVVLLDRGPIDSLVWFEFLQKLGLVSGDYAGTMRTFTTLPLWFDRIQLVVFVGNDWATYVRRYEMDSTVLDEPRMNERHFGILAASYQAVFREQLADTDGSGAAMRPHLVSINGGDSQSDPPAIGPMLESVWKLAHHGSIDVSRAILEQLCSAQVEYVATVASTEVADFLARELRDEEMARAVGRMFGPGAGAAPLAGRSVAPTVTFVERPSAEADPARVQIVAAAFIRHNGQILVLRRAASEEREQLRRKLSIVVSGHVERIDQTLRNGGRNAVENCLLRELREELIHLDLPQIRARFAIRTGDSEMARRHLALVYEVTTYSRRVNTVEVPGAGDFELGPQFWPVEAVKAQRGEFDEWSQLIIDRL